MGLSIHGLKVTVEVGYKNSFAGQGDTSQQSHLFRSLKQENHLSLGIWGQHSQTSSCTLKKKKNLRSSFLTTSKAYVCSWECLSL